VVPRAQAAWRRRAGHLAAAAGEDDVGDYAQFNSKGEGAPLSTSDDVTDDDLALLVRWVNPAYLGEDAAAKVQAKFEEDGSVQLVNFLRRDRAAEIGAAVAAADAAAGLGGGNVPKYDAGIGGGWKAVGPAHKQRYLVYRGGSEGAAPKADEFEAARAAGEALHRVQEDLMASAAFARLIRRLTTLTMVGQRSEVRRFRPGLDYTVAHYGGLTKDPRLDAVLCFVSDSDEAARTAWDSGEVGGFEAYLLADEDEDKPAEVYRGGDDDTGVLNVSPASNTLNLVLRDEGLMRFVKYVSCAAPSSRWDVAAVLLPEDDSDDEGEADGESGKSTN